MNAYLQIAETVLRIGRRPLSPQGILDFAYRSDLVPTHLHGKTQNKTLHARLSVDIVNHRDNSLFIRTAPGQFFLREFMTDASLPEEYRKEFLTRRRIRELMIGPALALEKENLQHLLSNKNYIEAKNFFNSLNDGKYLYDDPKNGRENSIFIWSFVVVIRDAKILSYRPGRYRDERDSFVHKRTVGFTTLVHRDERNLFNMENFGIIESGVHAAMIDLDIPHSSVDLNENEYNFLLKYILWSPSSEKSGDLLAVVKFYCPDWFEPLQRRLAMNDLQWLDFANPSNNMDDFDPWSKCVLQLRDRVFDNN